MISNEICPENDVVEAIIKNVIVPHLKQLKNDLGKLIYKCSVYIGNDEVYSIDIDDEGNLASGYNLQFIRIRFRTISVPNKLMFHVESVYSKDVSPKGTGFSGFETSGSINYIDLTIKNSTWVVRYNVWEWMGWR